MFAGIETAGIHSEARTSVNPKIPTCLLGGLPGHGVSLLFRSIDNSLRGWACGAVCRGWFCSPFEVPSLPEAKPVEFARFIRIKYSLSKARGSPGSDRLVTVNGFGNICRNGTALGSVTSWCIHSLRMCGLTGYDKVRRPVRSKIECRLCLDFRTGSPGVPHRFKQIDVHPKYRRAG